MGKMHKNHTDHIARDEFVTDGLGFTTCLCISFGILVDFPIIFIL